jgi:hypothetical protein
MDRGADRPTHITEVASSAGAHQPAATAKLHDDSRYPHIVDTPGGRVIELKVGPEDTLLNLGRELYRKYAHHEATPTDLKRFEADAAKRNKLSTNWAKDHLQLDRPLTLSLPGVTLPRPAHEEKIASQKVSHRPALPAAEGHVKPSSLMTEGHVRPSATIAANPTKFTAKPTEITAKSVAPALPNPELKALLKGGSSCSGEWSNMVAQWVTHNEVSAQKFLAFNPNDHGAGISIGLLQWNQKKGRLPELLKDWHQKDPGKFDHIFGGYSTKLLNADWVRSADFPGTPALNNGIHSALADGEFQQVQLSLRNEHIVKSCEVAQSNGFTSLRGRAVVADLFNQIGERGTEHALHKVSPDKPESARIEELKKVTGGRVNGHDRVSSIEDKVRDIWRQLGAHK